MTPTPPAVELARRLRELRTDARLTQIRLSEFFGAEGVGGATISTWESDKTPVTPPESRLEPYARLFATTGRPREQWALVPASDLEGDERLRYDALHDELTALRAAAVERQPAFAEPAEALVPPPRRSWQFDDDGPLAIICPDAPAESQGPLASQLDPNYTQTHAYADLDAVIELYGHVRAENAPDFRVTFKSAANLVIDDFSGHLVLLGGIGWNDLTRRILRTEALTRLPVRQVDDATVKTGEIFAVGEGAHERRFYPTWAKLEEEEQEKYPGLSQELVEDVGYLARIENPFNSTRTLTICNGIHSRGVLGAVRTLTDPRLRDQNEEFMAERFGTGEFAMLIKVPVVKGYAIAADLRKDGRILFAWPDPQESA
jgi:transcriptional regulator with XRE-family HTH domain